MSFSIKTKIDSKDDNTAGILLGQNDLKDGKVVVLLDRMDRGVVEHRCQQVNLWFQSTIEFEEIDLSTDKSLLSESSVIPSVRSAVMIDINRSNKELGISRTGLFFVSTLQEEVSEVQGVY